MKSVESLLSGQMPSPEEIEQFYIDREKFQTRKDIRTRQNQSLELLALREKTKEDSLNLLENAIFIRDEMVKAARYQLEIDRLNARTHQDSMLILEKESHLHKVEKEIDFARTKLELQLFEIRNKDIILISVIVGLLLLGGVLLLLVYKIRERVRLHAKLEDKNRRISRQNQNIYSSIKYAKNIQESILDKNMESVLIQEYFILFLPKDIVSGDFFWHWASPVEASGKVKFYSAAIDCTGHGVPGAFMSLIGNRLLTEIVNIKHIYEPAEILSQLHLELVEALNQNESENRDGMDVALCMIEEFDTTHSRIIYAGAKRPMYYHENSGGDIKQLKGDRKSIGRVSKSTKPVQFTQKEVLLEKGAVIYLTSDGFVDQCSVSREKIGTPRMIKWLNKVQEQPMKVQKQLMKEHLDKHQDKAEQRDDITLIGLRV